MKLSVIHSMLLVSIMVSAQNKPCQFDERTLQFVGSPSEQALCLLLPNQTGGTLGERLAKLPDPLQKLVGQKTKIKKEKLRNFLKTQEITEESLGGSLDEALVKAKLPNGEEIAALYFIIHDTSTPNYEKDDFPADINETTWKFNSLQRWIKNPVAHIFVSRTGDSLTTTPFAESVRKGWGTKFARDFLKDAAKGLQLHIELTQPRKAKPDGATGNDAIAPVPGFTAPQYQRLALLYICASIRRGTWLIPAYHSAIDAGIKDAHDDPQNFELEKFCKELKNLIRKL